MYFVKETMSLELIDSKKESKKISEPYLYTLKADKTDMDDL